MNPQEKISAISEYKDCCLCLSKSCMFPNSKCDKKYSLPHYMLEAYVEITRGISLNRLIEICDKEREGNNPLTLDEVKALKEGDMVWYKDTKKVGVVEFYEVNDDMMIYYSFGDECKNFADLSVYGKTYYLYRNKPDHIADVSKKEERK